MNAYEMLELLRDNVNEATAAVHSDVNLVRRLNRANNKVAMMIAMSNGSWLVKSASVTPVASVITLPADCAKPLYLLEAVSKTPVEWLLSVAYEGWTRGKVDAWGVGGREAYPLKNTIVVNIESYTTTCILYYQVRPPDLVVANSSNYETSGEATLVLPDDLNTKRIDDYYNDVTFEVVAGTGVGTVAVATDYVAATRTATVAGTFGADTEFGSVPFLPEEVHGLIVLEATASALGKPSTNIDPEVFKRFFTELRLEREMVESWIASRIPGAVTNVLIGDDY